jgi:transcriptional regulator with XRE-family HTH domain
MLLPNMLKAARALLGVRQSELAKAAGISLATLNNFERGIGDPRASTIVAIEQSLIRSGISFTGDGEFEGVTLKKVQRPSTIDTFTASHQILKAFERSSLLNIQSIVFYRNVETLPSEKHRQYVSLMIKGAERTIIFDQVRLSLETISHAAEVSGILLAAVSMYPDAIYYLPEFVSDTLRLPPPNAVEMVNETHREKLNDPADFFELFGLGADTYARWLMVSDHPFQQLIISSQSRILPR